MIRSYVDCLIRYGDITDGKWKREAEWCELLLSPPGLSWIKTVTGNPVEHLYCNKDMSAALVRAFGNIVTRGLASQLKTFDGLYEIRDVRGLPGRPSLHSYALAIDINAGTNRLGTPGDMSEELGHCFLDEGFAWGRRFHRMDPMHFSWGWE